LPWLGAIKVISVLQLGSLDYAAATKLQQRLVSLRKEGKIPDTLLLLEHPPVITLGRNAKASNVIASAELLASQRVAVFECDRGGDVTFHGPGQLVAYPIFDLRAFPSRQPERKTLGVIEFVRGLEEVLIRVCAEFGITTERVAGLTGVWTAPDGSSTQAKIAAIGVHISRGITSHGFALNVATDLTYFNLIIPCGIASKPVTSMDKKFNGAIAIESVINSVIANFAEVFQKECRRVETLDELLDKNSDIPSKPPCEFRKMHNEEETFWA
jgi:lipoyl(octanoyl) transferase